MSPNDDRFTSRSMHQSSEAVLTHEECGALQGKFTERTMRLTALVELDRALSQAANRYNLAAEVVHHGWPHRAD